MPVFKSVDKYYYGKGFCYEGIITNTQSDIKSATATYKLSDISLGVTSVIRSLFIRGWTAGGAGAKVHPILMSSATMSVEMITDLFEEIDISSASTAPVSATQSSASLTKYGLYNNKSITDLFTSANQISLLCPVYLAFKFTGANVPSAFKMEFSVDGMGNPIAVSKI